ncbi:Coenzyme F420-reducing hydrogenase, beta subunit [Sinomicrobium oceani]|uniref:Coenzyme F420-reducing hydrogenase, beta subunit n=1 Tax=Sinomicrobium oceani TaxID=1150368 RepID=A0A1K1QWJ8_9FLAO|nr:Coenzyme F420 hydrogenase/dehydrogenase, beta subunit C-terminal domain [Sinomicrobium oceani]SFW64003.1 Coenzyme F420-reducing hydrogenase, beta subunit [Sinomicrobium oceani]
MKNVISSVVANDLCVGCGMCVAVCPSESLKVRLGEKGTYEPFMIQDHCDETGNCLKVCPFNPFPDEELKIEEDISVKIGIQDSSYNLSKAFGRYYSLYAGYASAFREEASSGGVATWLLRELLKNKIVDYVIATIGDNSDEERFFKYTIIEDIGELDLTTKTKYYPIEVSEVLKLTELKGGKYAIIGLPCTIKAIRLAQINNPKRWGCIKFTISIFCGGLKSSFFTEYLASKVNVKHGEITTPKYRVKDIKSSASDYSFSCIKKGEQKPRSIPMKEVGDMWGTGYFKPNACDFCEDLSGELADISLGDAWIPPFSKDGRGHSIIITRTVFSNNLIEKGIDIGELSCKQISSKQVFKSQEGNYNHRRIGLSYRLKWASEKAHIVPPKRTKRVFFENPLKSRIFGLRQKIQNESTQYWLEERNNGGMGFEKKIYGTKKKLLLYTRIEHLFRKKYWLRKLKIRS